LPLTMLLFDRETTAILFIHNVGVDTALWTVGLWLLAAGGKPGAWKQVFNAPLVAIVLGVAMTRMNLAGFVPEPIIKGLIMLGHCAVPMSLLLIGATIFDFYTPKVSSRGLKVALTAAVLRLGLLPLIFIALILWLPCSIELKRVMAIHAGMPTAVFPILMSKHYDGDIPTAIRAVIGTATLSVITMAFWIQFALSLLP
ncbi:MAG: AEC family transporter, partial [Verrucomicrobiota bacterium]